MSNSPFDFWEVVRFVGDTQTPAAKFIELGDQEGTIIGRAENDDGRWGYSVRFSGRTSSAYCMDSELEATGRSNPELETELYGAEPTRICVRMTDEGEGEIVDENDAERSSPS